MGALNTYRNIYKILAIKPTFDVGGEITVQNDCLFWARRLIVLSPSLRKSILETLHRYRLGFAEN